jgi:hypothetical protein
MGVYDYQLNQLQIGHEVSQLRALRAAKIKNRGAIKTAQARIQALSESGRSILTTAITQAMAAVEATDKNKYTSYAAQVAGAYKMYNGTADFGGDVLGGCLDIRVAMIAGEGVSLSAENKSTQAFLDKFAKLNCLQGSRLIRMVELGELEGKSLLYLTPKKNAEKEKSFVKVRPISWQTTKYKVNTDSFDPEEITGIEYVSKDKPQKVNINASVYVRLGGSATDVNETPNRFHRLLTDFENMSRAKYDLNKNTRLFGKVIPTWETQDDKQARSIKKDMEADDFDIGTGFVGSAKMGLLEPTGAASDAIEKLFLLYLKVVSAGTGIPVHWLAFPELMSNRATAENLTEVINAATRKDRLLWEEGIHEAIEKAMVMSVDAGFEKNEIIDDFEVTLPFVSIEMLKAILDVYMPMEQAGLFSKKTLRDITPLGLDWRAEDRQIAREKKEAAKNSPVQNNTVNDALAAAQAQKDGAGTGLPSDNIPLEKTAAGD